VPDVCARRNWPDDRSFFPERWVSHFCEARALGTPLTATSQVATISKAAALA